VDRRKLERWHKEPFFEETIKGCYTRVFIGMDPKTREGVYRVAQVIHVTHFVYPQPLSLLQPPTDSYV